MNIEISNSFFNMYKKFDLEFNTHEDWSYEYLVNFSKTKDEPIHRWYYFQEGFSPKLVSNIFKHLNVKEEKKYVFDPFAGSGTTLVVAKQKKMKSLGYEINPFSAFIIKIKTRNYDHKEIEQIKGFVIPHFKSNHQDVTKKYELKIINKLFNREKLEKIEFLKQEIRKIKNEKVRDLLFGAFLSILEDVSNYRKGGNGLKKKTVKVDLDPFEQFEQKLIQISEDVDDSNNDYEPIIINDSCLNLEKIAMPNIDISIFSPPYANCFDPFEVYKIELWLGDYVSSYKELRKLRKTALASNLSADLNRKIDAEHRTELLSKILSYLNKQELWDKRIPRMLDYYFYDMSQLLKMLYQKTKDEGYTVIVVGNSAYGNLTIPVDIILSQLGKKVGFTVKEIIVARRNETSSQQYNKLGSLLEYIRESIIVLKK